MKKVLLAAAAVIALPAIAEAQDMMAPQPGVYLGVVFWDQKRTINFALDFNS